MRSEEGCSNRCSRPAIQKPEARTHVDAYFRSVRRTYPADEKLCLTTCELDLRNAVHFVRRRVLVKTDVLDVYGLTREGRRTCFTDSSGGCSQRRSSHSG